MQWIVEVPSSIQVKQFIHLLKTQFKCENIVLECDDNIFISIKEINELRRKAVNELINIRENKKE